MRGKRKAVLLAVVRTEADRGEPSRMAISPKHARRPRIAITRSPSSVPLTTSTSPSYSTYQASPGSPSWKTHCPGAMALTCIALTISASSLGSRSPNRGRVDQERHHLLKRQLVRHAASPPIIASGRALRWHGAALRGRRPDRSAARSRHGRSRAVVRLGPTTGGPRHARAHYAARGGDDGSCSRPRPRAPSPRARWRSGRTRCSPSSDRST